MNKIIIIIIIAAIIVWGGYSLVRSPQPLSQPSSTPLATHTQAPAVQQTPAANQAIITYTDTGYSPNTIRVKVGTTVTFKNNSSQAMWTASAFHPTHAVYPTTGGCIGSTFDACSGVQPGSSWPFKFDKDGSWKYHNHLNPSDTGTIIVGK